MNLLVIGSYPYSGHIYSGVFNQRSVQVIRELGHKVEVLAPRPYVPKMLSLCSTRWKAYKQISRQEVRDGVIVHRPAYLQIPRFAGAFCADPGRFLSCAHLVKRRQQHARFDAILAFNLILSGGMAWRLARTLKIPAAGWATGNDVRVPASSSFGRAVRLALQSLDLIFYQSKELLETAAVLCGKSPNQLQREKHVVLPRGILRPPISGINTRQRLRLELGIGDERIVVLYVGRITKSKGVFELVEVVRLASLRNPAIVCLMVGSNPVFDETKNLRHERAMAPDLSENIRILPACSPDKVWEYLYASDIFAFPSHNEGMPNSLLEAMAAGLPAVAYGIPAVLEIDGGKSALKIVPPFHVIGFSEAILELAKSLDLRGVMGKKGQAEVLSRFMAYRNMGEALQRLNTTINKCLPCINYRDESRV